MNGPTVLLIDDEEMIMDRTAGLLRAAGFAVHTCGYWPDVMQTIKDTKPSLILVDYNMPGLKGDDICSALKRSRALEDCKIAIFSSEDELKLSRIVEECGADGYLSKLRGSMHIVDGVAGLLS